MAWGILMRKKITWNILSKYRDELFGFSIISIIIFHYFEDLNSTELEGVFKIVTKVYLALIGSLGVEIFIFLSGLGLYYSMKNKFDIHRYIYKRVKRTIVPYIMYGGIFWLIFDIVIRKQSINIFAYDYSLLSFWYSGNKRLWFVTFIIVLYIIFPFIYVLIEKSNKPKEVLLIIALTYILILYKILKVFPNFFLNTEIALTRFPVFILGIYYGKKSYNNEKISKTDICILFSGILLRILSIFDGTGSIPIYWRLRMEIYSFFIMVVLVFCLNKISCKILNRCLSRIGKYSYELYLTSVTVRAIMNELNIKTYKLFNYIICVLVAIVLSYILVKVEKIIDRLI